MDMGIIKAGHYGFSIGIYHLRLRLDKSLQRFVSANGFDGISVYSHAVAGAIGKIILERNDIGVVNKKRTQLLFFMPVKFTSFFPVPLQLHLPAPAILLSIVHW